MKIKATKKSIFFIFAVGLFLVAVLLPGKGKKEVVITGHMAPLTAEAEKKFDVFRQFEAKKAEARRMMAEVAAAMMASLVSATHTVECAFTNTDSGYWEGKAKSRKLDKVYSQVLQKWGEVIKAEATQYNVDWRQVVAIICKESEGDPKAINKQDGKAYGLMQLRMTTAEWLLPGVTKEDLFDPELNIHLGVMRLAKAKELMKDDAGAVLAYHFGEDGAKRLMLAKDKTADQSDDWLFVNAIIKIANS